MSNTKPTTTPVVHLNGSNGQSLLDERLDALNALRAARKALQAITIHPRDFYVADNATARYEAAINERVRQLGDLDRLIEEQEAVAMELSDQIR